MKKTVFQMWLAGEVGNFGSFQTALFEAYAKADSGNTKKLNEAFPHWFTVQTTKLEAHDQ